MQKFINILVMVLAVFSIYYGVVVDYRHSRIMKQLAVSDVELQSHKSVIDEEYRRLTLKFEGRGKHMQRMSVEIANLQDRLQTVTDSLGNRIDELDFLMTQIEENLRAEIRSVEGDVRGLDDDLSTYKRNTNRSILDMQERINVIESDLKVLAGPAEGEEEDN
ncbi:MAG: hypothetical protein IID15_05680 [Candidatus Marinimicrobia bacterium]|nr:hypothetical protein [Candidatus Neomarinimicrobiota bacterium]